MENKTIEHTPTPAYPVFDRFFLCGFDNSLKRKEDCIWYDEEPDMGAHIPFCKVKNKFPVNPEDCQNCDRYTTKYKKTSISTSGTPITNGDKLRDMTDEELAEWIVEKGRYFGEEYEGYMSLLDWLKEAAENDGKERKG